MKQRSTEKVTFLVEGERTLPKTRLRRHRFLLRGEKNATQVESTWDLEDTTEQRKGPKRRSFNWRKKLSRGTRLHTRPAAGIVEFLKRF